MPTTSSPVSYTHLDVYKRQEYIKKYGAERFKALLDGVGNALDFRLGRLRSQYDLAPVSYTHLDVYKRQPLGICGTIRLATFRSTSVAAPGAAIWPMGGFSPSTMPVT